MDEEELKRKLGVSNSDTGNESFDEKDEFDDLPPSKVKFSITDEDLTSISSEMSAELSEKLDQCKEENSENTTSAEKKDSVGNDDISVNESPPCIELASERSEKCEELLENPMTAVKSRVQRHKFFQISPASIPAIMAQRTNFQLLPPINETGPISHKKSLEEQRFTMELSNKLAQKLEAQTFSHDVDGQASTSTYFPQKENSVVNDNHDTPTSPRFDIMSNQNSIHDRYYDTITTRNYDTMNAFPGSACHSNSTTIERPPNINAYRITIVKAMGNRASMPQLMHGYAKKNKGGNDTSSIQNGSTIHTSNTLDDISSIERGLERFSPDSEKKNAFAFQTQSSDFEGRCERRRKESRLKPPPEPKHFFDAVFIPAFTNIVGTLLYLRMGYVAGQAGILAGIGIVLFSTFVIGVTAISLSAICSNGKQLKGGVYYIISRSLGPQIGGVISVIFSLANVGMGALYIVGIAEFTSDLLTENEYDFITISKQDDIRLFSLIVCFLLMLIYFAGPDIENSFTLIFFSTYVLSYINWLLGTLLPVSQANSLRGVTGYSWITAQMNMFPEFRRGESLITVFAVFFPGFTGMLAGVMYVDQLRNPGSDVAMGLFTSISTTALMYVVAVIACGATMLRDASGVELPYIDNSTGQWHTQNCTYSYSCRYGLMNYYQVAEMTSAWHPLLIIGMFGMTISSTMTNMDQGPQNFQAACKDAIFPYMKYFAKEYGRAKLPRRAYILLALLTMALTLIGDLNVLNEIVTNMFMATYALVNYACFDASFIRAPGWRPEFPFYSMWVSLFGAILCIIVMFVVSIESSITICVMFASFLAYFHYFHPEVDWGDSHQAHLYKNALNNLLKLSSTQLHVKNYRPQILLLSGNPASRIPLLDFAHSITKGDSLLFCAHVVHYPNCARVFGILLKLEMEFEKWLRRNKFKCFYQNLASENFRLGVAHVFQLSGLGRLRPNVLLLGFKGGWHKLPRENVKEIDDYVGVIRDAFESNYGVLILRNGADGLDLSEEMLRNSIKDVNFLRKSNSITVSGMDASLNDTVVSAKREQNSVTTNNYRKQSQISVHKVSCSSATFYSDKHIFEMLESDGDLSEMEREIRQSETIGITDKDNSNREILSVSQLSKRANVFRKCGIPSQRGQLTRRIDVWWLYDDGGLTLLIPHLLRMPKSYLEGAELRVLTLSGTGAEVDEASIVALLIKFRIEFSAVKVIEIAKQKLKPEIWHDFMATVKPWRLGKNERAEAQEENRASLTGLVTDIELAMQKKKTYRQLLTRQLLDKYSHNASLIVLTLPIPNELISSCLYIAWLDVMTRGLPPVLFARGNQTSVLTFYS